MISYFAFSGLLNFIISFLFGVLVYFKGKRDFLTKIFLFGTFSTAFWSFGYFKWQTATDFNSALFWSRVLMTGAIFIPVFYFHFVILFLNLVEKYKKILIGVYGIFIFFFFANFTPYFVKTVKPTLFFPFWPKPGILYHPFLVVWIGIIFYVWYLLLRALKQIKEKVIKQQIKYFLLGTGIGFVCGATNYFLWYDIPIPPYLNVFVSLYVVLTAFAILKYHLFGIRIILTEILIGLMAIILGVLPFLMPTKNLKILTSFLFFLFLIFAYYLIKAVHEEERRREEAQVLAIREKTLRKRAEKLANELERLNRAKDQFILSIQHHLRTPLTPVIGYLSMILEGTYGEISNPIKEKLIAMQNSVNVLHRLIENLLDITQLRVGKKILNFEKVKLEDLIEEVVNELMPQATQKGLKIEFEKKALPQMMLDKMRMREAIFNILDNSIRYTQKGKVKISFKVENSNCLIEIQDTGIGMTKEEIENFLKGALFERGIEAKKMWGPGKGIGLTVALEFIKAHGGEILIFSEGRGKGTTFIIKLPIK